MIRIVQNPTNPKYTFKMCDLGDKCYYVVWGDFIIPCTINGLANVHASQDKIIWSHEQLMLDGSIKRWHYKPNGKINEGGWDEFDVVEGLPDLPIVNQFIDIDEPIGHSVSLDDEVFETLEEALENILPTKRKHLKRRLNHFRNSGMAFIASTWQSGRKYGEVSRKNYKALLKRFKEVNNPYPPKKIIVRA